MKRHPAMWIITIIMVLCTIYVLSASAQTFSTDRMPFDMSIESKYTYPLEIAVMLLILTGIMAVADFYCFRFLFAYTERNRSVCNNWCFAAWIMGLLIFVYGFTSFGGTWAYFLAVTLPPLITWFITSPKIQIAGDSW